MSAHPRLERAVCIGCGRCVDCIAQSWLGHDPSCRQAEVFL